jgi:putative flippase GtrA
MTAEVRNLRSETSRRSFASPTKKHERAQRISSANFSGLRELAKGAHSVRGYFSPWIIQALKYALVGMSNTLIDAAAYYTLTRWLWLGSLPVAAKGMAYTIGMINSFYWNRNWTFNRRGSMHRTPTGRAAFYFTLTHIAALGINAGVMYLGLEIFNLSEVVSLVLATGMAFGWNFVLNKHVVFKA